MIPINGINMERVHPKARKLGFLKGPIFDEFRLTPARDASRAAAIAFLSVFTACSTADHPQSSFYPARAERVFAAGYANIQEKYIHPVNIADLAFEGVENLDDIDPELHVTKTGYSVQLNRGNLPVMDIAMPNSEDPHAWARFTTRTIQAARTESPPLQEADSEKIYETIFTGVLLPLDPHSRYAGLESARDYRAQREGFGGIGVRLDFEGELPEIISVLPNTPAKGSPLRSGDIITHVDGASLIGLDRHDIIWRLRGLVGTEVRLQAIHKNSEGAFSVTLKRSRVFTQTVEYQRRGSIAVIHLIGFNQRTAQDLERLVVRLLRNDAQPIKGIVLDLRNNPGGLLDQAVAVANAFLDKGTIVSTLGRHPESIQRFNATGRDLADGLPMVVLVNGRSASAAEIVAAALQDTGRAVVVGSNSYGKGTVQNITRLPNDGELILTWSRFHAPSGYALDALGVLPNVCTSKNIGSKTPNLRNRVLAAIGTTTNMLASWRTLAGFDKDRGAGLREECPKHAGMPDIDFKIAREIIGDKRLYARTIGMSAPRIAKDKSVVTYAN